MTLIPLTPANTTEHSTAWAQSSNTYVRNFKFCTVEVRTYVIIEPRLVGALINLRTNCRSAGGRRLAQTLLQHSIVVTALCWESSLVLYCTVHITYRSLGSTSWKWGRTKVTTFHFNNCSTQMHFVPVGTWEDRSKRKKNSIKDYVPHPKTQLVVQPKDRPYVQTCPLYSWEKQTESRVWQLIPKALYSNEHNHIRLLEALSRAQKKTGTACTKGWTSKNAILNWKIV